jgi:hypothetical protein
MVIGTDNPPANSMGGKSTTTLFYTGIFDSTPYFEL